MSDRAPAFQFYPKDFIGDSRVMQMSLQERGAYISLICFCWDDGWLPADVTKMARLVGATPGQMQKLWPALSDCFKPHPTDVGKLIHPRLERELEKQQEFRQRQSQKGKASAANRKATKGQPEINRGSNLVDVRLQPESNSSIFNLQSSISRLQSEDKKASASETNARSKWPIFKGRRFVVFDWMLEDMRRSLGSHCDGFDLHSWFYELDEATEQAGVVVPQRDSGKWLQEQMLAEAARRGLPIVATGATVGKTAGNQAAAARFVARGQQS